MERYAWTTGGDTALVHVQVLGIGGYAEVHKVRASLIFQLRVTWLTVFLATEQRI